MSAAKYCSHGPPIDSGLADLGDDTAAAACDFGSCHVEREEFTQKPGGGISVERKAGLFLVIHGPIASLQIDSGACRSETFRLDQVALMAELQQRLRGRFDEAGRTANENLWSCLRR